MGRSKSRSRERHKKHKRSRSPHRKHHKHQNKHDRQRQQKKQKHRKRSRSSSRRERSGSREKINKASGSSHNKQQDHSRQKRQERSTSRERNATQERGKYYKQKIDPNLVKQQPCFTPSGILLEFYNNREGVALKFHEPPEARAPTDHWRLYPFKENQEPLAPILLAGQSCFLFGKDPRVCDILAENPSISRQHAVIQFRQIKTLTRQGAYLEEIKPYLMDLESMNGTILNNQKIPTSRYVELFSQDRIKFGQSQREYILLRDEDVINQKQGEGSEEN